MRDKQTLLFAFVFLFGFACATWCQPSRFEAEYKLNVEEGYGGGGGGVRFVNLSRTNGYEPLTFAGDEQLPLTQFLLARNGKRVKITIEDAQERTLERIDR
jgi:hypothetical protein